ncbi:MAG: Oxidoreductase, partial [Solirubrobacterales bacterium]|nr:Oxidoreductase [Solirubrobacterales bacterium]
EALLRAPIDAVYLATPNHTHRPLAEACAAAGLPVLCEKPMATSHADAAAMVDACARAGVPYATAHNQRWHPAHTRLRELVAGGALGTVRQARIHYACTAPAWWGEGDWHWDREQAGGGALFDLAPHGLDLVATLLDEDLEEVAAMAQGSGSVEEGAILLARYGGDVLLTLQVSYACPDTLPRRRLELLGTAGMAVAENTMGQTPGGKLTLVPAADGVPQDVPFDLGGDPFALQLAAFERVVAGEAPWPWPVARDLAVMAAIEAAARASPRPCAAPARPGHLGAHEAVS